MILFIERDTKDNNIFHIYYERGRHMVPSYFASTHNDNVWDVLGKDVAQNIRDGQVVYIKIEENI